MKRILTLQLAIIAIASYAQNNGKMTERELLRLNSTYLGMEWLTTKPLVKNGFDVTRNLYGPSIELMGTMSVGYLTGFAHHADSNLDSRARMLYYGFHWAPTLLKSRLFNIRPEIGMKLIFNQLNYYLEDYEWDANGLGAGLHAGVSVNLGPVMAKFKYHADAAYNLGGNSFESLNHYGSLTIGVSPMNLFMNPKNFSQRGLARSISDYKKTYQGQNVEFKKNGDGSTTKTTTAYYKETWKENYGIQDFRCKDVQPFLWVGPRLVTNLRLFDVDKMVGAWGVNVGGRYGSLWVNSFYEAGDVPFTEPFKGKYDFVNANNAKRPRFDGKFENSNRYGIQVGLELVTYLQKKDFIYIDSKLRQATSHFSFTPFVGFVNASLGNLSYYDLNGENNKKSYLSENGGGTANDIALTPTNINGFNFGFQMGVGAAAFNLERVLYRKDDVKYPLIGKWQFGISYNIPIIRVGRAITAKSRFKAAWEESKKLKDPTQ